MWEYKFSAVSIPDFLHWSKLRMLFRFVWTHQKADTAVCLPSISDSCACTIRKSLSIYCYRSVTGFEIPPKCSDSVHLFRKQRHPTHVTEHMVPFFCFFSFSFLFYLSFFRTYFLSFQYTRNALHQRNRAEG
jgi:hypothetical protein